MFSPNRDESIFIHTGMNKDKVTIQYDLIWLSDFLRYKMAIFTRDYTTLIVIRLALITFITRNT